MRRRMKLLALGIVGIFVAQAQQPASVATSAKGAYTRIKNNFVKAAEKMPEENYGFKPVDALETFGQRVAHIADPQLGTCTGLTGARKTGMAKSKTSKAELVAAIKESFDCLLYTSD